MILYSVRVFLPGDTYSVALGRRLLPRHRAKRVAAWLSKRGCDAYAAPARVTA